MRAVTAFIRLLLLYEASRRIVNKKSILWHEIAKRTVFVGLVLTECYY